MRHGGVGGQRRVPPSERRKGRCRPVPDDPIALRVLEDDHDDVVEPGYRSRWTGGSGGVRGADEAQRRETAQREPASSSAGAGQGFYPGAR